MYRLFAMWMTWLVACGAPANETESSTVTSTEPAGAESGSDERASATRPDPESVPADPRPTPPPEATTEAPPAAPGAEGAPPQHLVPWQMRAFGDGERPAILAVGAEIVVLDSSHAYALSGDGRTPTRVRALGLSDMGVFGDRTLPHPPIAAGAALIRPDREHVAAIDLTSLEVRWTRELGAERSHEAHLATTDTFIVRLRERLVVLDATDGELIREETFRPNTVSQRFRTIGDLLLSYDGELKARDGRTGETRWECPGIDWAARLFDVVDGVLPVVEDHETVILVDVTDGSERGRFRLRSELPAGQSFAIRDGRAYVTSESANGMVRVTAYDLETGRPAWRSRPTPMDATGFHPSLVVDDDAIVVCVNARTGVVLDRRRGRPLGALQAASCRAPRLWRPREGAPNVLFLNGGHPETAFARAADAPERARVTVTGRVTCDGRAAAGAEVWVRERRVRADDGGVYRARIEHRGPLALLVHQHAFSRTSFCAGRWQDAQVSGPRLEVDFALSSEGGRVEAGDPLGGLE